MALLAPSLIQGDQTALLEFAVAVCSSHPANAIVDGIGNLPDSPRFLLCANHYQRRGLWILHPAAVITAAIGQRYSALDPPIRWVVTANWPPWQFFGFRFSSPGDLLLRRVARSLDAFPIPFAGGNPAATARSYRQLLRRLDTPVGLFPEGTAGAAQRIGDALPGVERLIAAVARTGVPVLPCRISEEDRCLRIRFAPTVSPPEIEEAGPHGARLVMDRIRTTA